MYIFQNSDHDLITSKIEFMSRYVFSFFHAIESLPTARRLLMMILPKRRGHVKKQNT